ncbi:MAG TPA: alpha/beta fold hydrolase, partial [Burkholderiaceae bacterium]
MADQPLVDFKGFDFNGYFQYDYGSGRILGLHYHSDANGAVWFDTEMKKAQQTIDQILPATINTIFCGANCLNSSVLLIRSNSDKQPNQYFIYKKSDSSLIGLGSGHPHIDPKLMGQRDFYRYKARDGMEIPVYITQPPGPHQDKLPTVVLVHGGPWLRGGSWEWDSAAQFLASRGYMVIQPEFRGSTGFGYAHYRAGFKQWGLAMQDDLTDAADWAVKKGWADPKRIGIMGGSYGGYATLMGLIKTPEVFRCGVAFAAETDLNELLDSPINDISMETQQVDMKVLVGDPDADAAMFKANSPLYHPDAIRSPLLMMHGGLDRRVPIGKASSLVSKVKDNNKNVEWIVYNDEGHGLAHESNVIDFWARVETFLNKYLRSTE